MFPPYYGHPQAEHYHKNVKGKAIPLQALDRPLGLQEVEVGRVVSPTHRQPLPPRKDYWYSFLLEAESTPEPQCGQKD